MKKLFIVCALVLCAAMPASAGEINLAVAASLKDVVQKLTEGYARKNPGIRFTLNSGGTGMLAKQLDNGARADIFISANTVWLEYLQKRQLLEKSGVILAYNTLVFAAPPDRKVYSMRDLAGLERIAIGNSASVPAGEYALEALRRGGMDKLVAKKLVMARDVRECLMYVERGEVDGAFVYRTDALMAKRLSIRFTVPQELYQRVTYPMGLTPAGSGNREAVSFFSYLQGSEARGVLAKYGFEVK